VTDQVRLAKVFNFDCDVGHGSDEIREALFHLAELADAKPQEKDDDAPAQDEAGQVKIGFTAEDGPAESVDNAHDRVDRVQQAPLFGHDGGAEAHRRDVQAELDDEGDDVAEVSVLDVERGNPQPRSQACEKGHEDEEGKSEDLPAREELVPNHQADEDREANE